jgi:hypothetical protein
MHARRLLNGPFDFARRDGEAVSISQYLVGGNWLPINPDQIILGASSGNALLKEALNGGSFRYLDVIGEAAAIIVDVENSHD